LKHIEINCGGIKTESPKKEARRECPNLTPIPPKILFAPIVGTRNTIHGRYVVIMASGIARIVKKQCYTSEILKPRIPPSRNTEARREMTIEYYECKKCGRYWRVIYLPNLGIGTESSPGLWEKCNCIGEKDCPTCKDNAAPNAPTSPLPNSSIDRSDAAENGDGKAAEHMKYYRCEKCGHVDGCIIPNCDSCPFFLDNKCCHPLNDDAAPNANGPVLPDSRVIPEHSNRRVPFDGKAAEPDHVPRIAEVASVLREFRV
jgi:hypothetical protein